MFLLVLRVFISNMGRSVCIFCASSTRVPEIYHIDAEEIASLLVFNGVEIKYGGGSVGLMGSIANTALKNKGEIIGVIPQFMVDMEWANNKITNLIIVEDMQERKKKMIENVDAVVALAGGIGTLDELIEVITLRQLGQFTKPIIILNTNNFYNDLLNQLDTMISEGFMRESHKTLWHVVQTPKEAVLAISQLEETDNSIIKSAQV